MSDSNETSTALPSATEALKNLSSNKKRGQKAELSFVEKERSDFIGTETAYAHLIGTKEHYKQKTLWSTSILCLMGLMSLFQIGLIIAVGMGSLDYTKYEWLLPTLMIQYFGQIVSLAFLVVQSLFKKIN